MDDSSFLNRSRFGRLRQARRSVAPYAMLRYLLLLANPAQLIPVNPGKDEHTSRSAIVLGTDHEHDDDRGRCVSLQKIYFEPDACVIHWSRLHRVFEPAGSPFCAVVATALT
jgi:hypothetical protein